MATGITSRRSLNYKNSTNYKINNKTKKATEKQLKELQSNARKASKILGVTKLEMLDFPDNEMDKVSNLEIHYKDNKHLLEETIKEAKDNN